jgi:hypothetical protein
MVSDESPQGTRRWRLLVSLAVTGVVFHISWACGFIPGLDGFAHADVLNKYRDEVTNMHAEMLEQALLDTRTRQCVAIEAGNVDARYYSTQKFQELYVLYWRLAGKDYRIPDCKEVR